MESCTFISNNNVMKQFFTLILFIGTATIGFAQDFIISPSSTINTTIQTNEYVTAQINFEHNTTGDLTLEWDLIEKVAPVGWDYSFCDYTTCYDATKVNGTMTPFSTGQSGFIKVNVMTTIEGWAYFKFAVYNELAPQDADTVEFWFNGIASIKTVTKEDVSIYPNPVNAGENWSIKNIPLNASVEIFNSLGQKIGKTIQATSSTLTMDGRLSKGAYIVKIHHDNAIITRKLIIR